MKLTRAQRHIALHYEEILSLVALLPCRNDSELRGVLEQMQNLDDDDEAHVRAFIDDVRKFIETELANRQREAM